MPPKPITHLEELYHYRDQILSIIHQHHAHSISVFGSLVRGEMTDDSDIDFLVDFAPEYKLRDLIRLTQALQSLLGRRVEVIDRSTLRDEFRATILQEARHL